MAARKKKAKKGSGELIISKARTKAAVKKCNVGGEFMSDDKIERIKEIGKRRWTRTLSDRKGISFDELERKARSPEASLPTVESLLEDREDLHAVAGDRHTEPNVRLEHDLLLDEPVAVVEVGDRRDAVRMVAGHAVGHEAAVRVADEVDPAGVDAELCLDLFDQAGQVAGVVGLLQRPELRELTRAGPSSMRRGPRPAVLTPPPVCGRHRP